MTKIFIFLPLDPSRFHPERRRGPFQRLNPGFLIAADDVNPGPVQRRRLLIDVTHLPHPRFKFVRIVRLGRQPVFDPMRLEFHLILKNARLASR